MSIWAAAHRVIGKTLAQDCVLCGAASGDALLCASCAQGLPALEGPRCPVCALPAPGGTTCGACLKSAPAYDATLAVWRYGFPVDKLVQTLKYEHRLSLAGYFVAAMLDGPRPTGDLILPLPLSARRLAERGFNQAVEIARPLAQGLGLPLEIDACRRTRETVPQASLPWKERRRNVRHCFECAADFSGKSIIVVDDVMTTGATLDEFAALLKRHGAAHVTNWVVARAVRG